MTYNRTRHDDLNHFVVLLMKDVVSPVSSSPNESPMVWSWGRRVHRFGVRPVNDSIEAAWQSLPQTARNVASRFGGLDANSGSVESDWDVGALTLEIKRMVASGGFWSDGSVSIDLTRQIRSHPG